MSTFKDFVGLNYCIYDPIAADIGAVGGNFIGYAFPENGSEWYSDAPFSNNQNISYKVSHSDHSTLVLLNLHRNGPFGYPMWKQIRASENKLTKHQIRNNIFTYSREDSKEGVIKSFVESPVASSYHPLTLVGDMSLYNEATNTHSNKSVEIKSTFANETIFFSNDEPNMDFDTTPETDDSYEEFKSLYLNGGLEDEGSPLQNFNLMIYKQTVYPKEQYTFLDQTRSRKFYVNTYWRTDREDRERIDIANQEGVVIPKSSMWPLDVPADWNTRTVAELLNVQNRDCYFYFVGGAIGAEFTGNSMGGFNTGDDTASGFGVPPNFSQGGGGVLMNSYSQIARGLYDTSTKNVIEGSFTATPADAAFCLTSSVQYSKKHTLNAIGSTVSPSGMDIAEATSDILTGSLFQGEASWDAYKQNPSFKEPFYDSYGKYAEDLRIKGKDFTTVPEFKISSHVLEIEQDGFLKPLPAVFESSGALNQNTTTENNSEFYKILNTSDFLKHFDLVKKDNKDLAKESVLTLRCKALKKFLPYKGFYPAERTVQISDQFMSSYSQYLRFEDDSGAEIDSSFSSQPFIEPLFAPGVLFNTIKSGIAVDYPLVFASDEPQYINYNKDGYAFDPSTGSDLTGTINYSLASSNNSLPGEGDIINTVFSTRIPFESLVEPEKYLSSQPLTIQEPHPFGMRGEGVIAKWDGQGDKYYKKMMNNFLAEIPEFFLKDQSFKTLVSLEEQDPNFGNVLSGNFYTMRVKMRRSRTQENDVLEGFEDQLVTPPQDHYAVKGVRESFTMYSRPSAFGPSIYGHHSSGSISANRATSIAVDSLDSIAGNNYCYTPPYYYGEAWCDLVYEATSSGKVTLDDILLNAKEYPYYTRYWWPGVMDAARDLSGYQGANTTITGPYTGYDNSPWAGMVPTNITLQEEGYTNDYGEWGDNLYDANAPTALKWRFPTTYIVSGSISTTKIIKPPQHPILINTNAMHISSSVNLFGKGTIKKKINESTNAMVEVASSDTIRGKTRWIIQPKFETPMLNFNKYTDLRENNCTQATANGGSQVPRGMWHQYGEIPQNPKQGVFLEVADIPRSWLKGTLGVEHSFYDSKVKSLADLVGFSKEPVRLGEVAFVKEISEAVVAVPFIEKNGTRQFFSIPREDIDSCIGATKREVEPGTFVAGGPPKAGESVYQMVKKMQKYVFPPTMDFVKFEEIDPFAMYVFEFKHNLSQQDVADIWQNLPPDIGTTMQEAESTISHELLAHELLGGGSVVKNGILDDNVEGKGIPSNIQWMIFKVKKKAKTNYFDKVVEKSSTTSDVFNQQLENAQGQTGEGGDATYNWPYDFFSLVELVKIDAEVVFANIENDDKGQKSIKKVRKKEPIEVLKSQAAVAGINIALGKGGPKK